MNTDRLIALYERVADAPEAVTRLRRFILDLAVRGKLVTQDLSDEAASELLKRIAIEKARMVKAGAIRKPNAVQNLESDNLPFAIPRGWTWTQIAKIGIISPRNEADDDFVASFVPMQMIAAEYGLSNEHEPRQWGEIKKGYTHFAEGDVGLAKITPCFENRKSTVFRNLTGGIGSGTTELHVVRPIFVEADYVVLFLKSPCFIEAGIPRMTGTAGQKRVPTEYFTSTPFPLPPLAEQRRIMAKVDELMALLDRLEAGSHAREATRDRLAAATLARLTAPDTSAEEAASNARFAVQTLPALTTRPDQIKPLRQTILNLAVRGKLVEQDSADEPATEILVRLRREQKRAAEREGIRSRAPVEFLDRHNLWFSFPEPWALTQFDEVFTIVSGVTKGQKIAPSDSVEAPYLRVANVQRGFLDLAVIKTITVKSADMSRYALHRGDILMTEGGDWDKLGRAAIWRDEIPTCIHQNHVFRVRPASDEILPEWVITYANSLIGRHFFEEASKQTTNLASINMTQLRGCPLPLPPLVEQHRIVAKVEALMALCDQLEAALKAANTTRARLLEALLHEALEPGGPMLEDAA